LENSRKPEVVQCHNLRSVSLLYQFILIRTVTGDNIREKAKLL